MGTDLQSNESSTVSVPETPCPLSDVALAELQMTVDPRHPSDMKGIDTYLETLTFVNSHL